MCKVLKVSRSGYYKWLKSTPSKRSIENQSLLGRIRQIHQDSKQTYGSPRVAKALQKEGYRVSRPRVARLMNRHGIRSAVKKRFVATTDSRHHFPVAPNLLKRNFEAASIGQAWVSDITYVSTRQGWLYLTVIIDLADRMVIGWAISNGMAASQTTIPAFRMAVNNRPINQPLIFHSDRGVQYACGAFTRMLAAYPLVRQSMSRKANCWDNAVAESFFKTLKVELVYRHKYQNQIQANKAVFEYIEIWYNRRRIHSALGYLTPYQKAVQLKHFINAA